MSKITFDFLVIDPAGVLVRPEAEIVLDEQRLVRVVDKEIAETYYDVYPSMRPAKIVIGGRFGKEAAEELKSRGLPVVIRRSSHV